MDNLSMIFSKSSIHGLPYLTSKDHGALGRLAWLICVLVSFSLAGVVIWSNVYNWRSQPAVVSSVEYDLVEGQPWMPQVMVCPTTLNAGSMLTGLLSTTHQEVLNTQLMEEFKMALTKMRIMEDFYLSDRWMTRMSNIDNKNLTSYESCFDHKTITPEHCHLILILAVLLDKFGYTEAQKTIVSYTADSYINPDTRDILDYMKKEKNISLSDINAVTPVNLKGYQGVLSLYMTFFTVYEQSSSTVLEPQLLRSYRRSMIEIHLPQQKDFGNFLAWVLNGYSELINMGLVKLYNPVLDFYSLVSEIWLNSLKAYLKVNSHHEATLLMNSFWHGMLESDLFQPSVERRNNSYMCLQRESGKQSVKYLRDTCDQSQEAIPECADYCQLMGKVSKEMQSRIKEVFLMGLDVPSSQIGTFQTCQHPTKGMHDAQRCWRKVINDKGVCFTSKGDGSLGNTVPGAMKDAPIRFLFDGGRHMNIFERKPGTYQLLLSKKTKEYIERHLHIHVIPYGQHSVEDMLMEENLVATSLTVSNDPQAYFVGNSNERLWINIDHILDSTEAFKSMDPSHKKCYLPYGEKSLKHFKGYTEADCMLECAWEVASKHCQCVPWYMADIYPSDNMCETFGNRCFGSVIKSRYKNGSLAQKHCQPSCLLNCDRIQFEISGNNIEGDMDPVLLQDYSSKKIKKIPPEVLLLSRNQTNRFETTSNMVTLELRLSNSKLAQKIVRTATMTTTDLISNVGGTLGLFCGLSVLSLAEVVYWTGRVLWGMFRNSKHVRDNLC